MNKYLKMLMLSGGLVGSIIPTAIDMDNKQNNDLGGIYEQVEKMQEALPRLSRINYKLNIDLSDNNESDALENNDTNNDNNTINDEIPTDNTENSHNVTFTTTDDTGKETNLSNEETINYLDETLNQTNIEYESLKTTLNNAIKDTMDYLDAYKNGETTLTNEQKIYIKEHANSIKFLAETLEDLSEDVLCCIDGCEDCDNEEDFEATASKYLTTINDLETRINALNNAIASLQFINNICNPYFFRAVPNYIMYDYNNLPDDENQDNVEENNSDLNISNDNVMEVENDQNLTDETSNDSVDNNQSTQDNVVNESQEEGVNNENDKPTTFGLKSNIDTYAPTRRNIDTFFNTALYNKNDYMNGNAYGYGYGVPYGYGGGYGYGMPYGQGYYGSPYGMGLNSNMVNRAELEKQENSAPTNTYANIETKTDEKDVKKPKNKLSKRAKNIDTYTGVTVKSNVNTMGESKISRFFKEKFNTLRNKIRRQKQDVQDNAQNLPNNLENQDNLDNNSINQNNENNNINTNNIPEPQNDISDRLNNNVDNQLEVNSNTNNEDVNNNQTNVSLDDIKQDEDKTNETDEDKEKDNKNTLNNVDNSNPTPHQEKDIKAKIK